MKNLLKYVIISIISASFLIACGVDDKQSVEAARKYTENNQLRAANLELKNALQGNPDNAEARYLLGQNNLTIGDMESAAKEFRKAAEAGWDEGESKIGLARAWIYSRQFEKLLDEIAVIEVYSKSVQANLYGLRAYAEAALGYEGLAKESIDKGKEIDNEAYHVFKTAIQFDLAKGNTNEAAAKLETALSLYQDDAELLLLKAYMAIKDDDTDMATAQFLKVISKEPKVIVTYNGRIARIGLARLEIIAKDMEKANELLAPLFKQNPNDPEVNYLGAALSFEEKKYDEAKARILKVLKLAPDHAKSQLLLGTVNFAQKDYEQAAYYIGKYLQQDPGNAGARKLLGRTYLLLGQNDDAQDTLTSGLNDDEKDAELLALVGLSQLQAGNTESGIEGLQKALQAAPESQALKNELAKAYITAGETEKAINQLNVMIEEGGNINQAEALKVLTYLKSKQYDEAIDTSLNILSRSPEDVAVLSLVGNVFAASGDRLEARKYFNKALEIDAENTLPMMLLAGLEEVDGNSEEAERLYQRVATKDGSSIGPLLALARLSEQKKDYAQMVRWLEKASEKAPMELRPKMVLAEYYLREKQLDKVELLVKEASDINTNDPAVLMIKSRLMIAQQRFNKAIPPLTELVTRMPNSIYAHSLLGETYLRLGQHEDARRQLELALDQQPYYVPALLILARLDQVTGRYDEALEHIEKVKKTEPEQHLAYDLGGDIYVTLKDYDAAVKNYKRVMSLKPNSATAIKYAEALTRLSQKRQAIDLLEQWLIRRPDDLRARQFLGNAYLNNDENAKATKAFEAVYEKQPDNVAVLNNLAWLYSRNKDTRALGYAERAYKLKPENFSVQDTYGWILVQQGQFENGRRILEAAMNQLSSVPEVRYHYAVALMKTGDENKAREIFADLLESKQQFYGREQVQRIME